VKSIEEIKEIALAGSNTEDQNDMNEN